MSRLYGNAIKFASLNLRHGFEVEKHGMWRDYEYDVVYTTQSHGDTHSHVHYIEFNGRDFIILNSV